MLTYAYPINVFFIINGFIKANISTHINKKAIDGTILKLKLNGR